MITTIQRWGNSQAVRLPKTILETLFLQENDQVAIIAENDAIVIKKATRRRRAKKSLTERFENYSGDYQCTECDWGAPFGKEVW
ncbi:MAG: AbrB/MazE/SpoVT family DNA-binding domain-containing protein [Clostridiales bacterium]|nr:AbrB/MazE/SpoVT family DNA-binding domain-containing protein [Clostridiales bacterium]